MRLDPTSPDRVANPFEFYEQVRTAGRCVRDDQSGSWLIAGYSDAAAILRDNRLFSSKLMSNNLFGPWYDGAATMLGSDFPDHQRLRSVLQPCFTARRISDWTAELHRIGRDLLASRGLIDKVRDGAGADFMGTFAETFPVRVICRLLGIADEDQCEWIAGLTTRMARGSAAAMVDATSPAYTDAVTAGRELADNIRTVVTARKGQRTQPDGVIASLLDAESAQRISPQEVCATLVLLLLAGTDTVANAIGNSVVTLAEHPTARQQLATDPTVLGTAVEEILRFNGPTQFDPRLAMDDVDIGETQVQPGETVLVLQGAANRDPARFDRPSHFDITRTPNPHLSFGSGPHLCLGAALARLQMRTAISLVLEWIPNYAVEAVTYGDSLFVRGPTSLLITSRIHAAASQRSNRSKFSPANNRPGENHIDAHSPVADHDVQMLKTSATSQNRVFSARSVDTVACDLGGNGNEPG